MADQPTLRRPELPPRPADLPGHDDPAARRRAQEARDALVRGVSSIGAMRDAVRAASRALPALAEVARVRRPTAAAFLARAAQGLPFVMTGIVDRWPLSALTPQVLREQYGAVPVRARIGDYVNTAFARDRAMRDMAMADYLGLVTGEGELPPYVGNLELRELNRLCHWPGYFAKMGPPRFWIGPARTVTPLHCDFDDNIFAQVWGSKRIFLVPPHHDAFLYTREANPVLFGSPVDPEAPDFARFPLARQASMIECIVGPGDMLYVPAGWYHQVRALGFSLSANRWARAMPLALHGTAALLRPAAPPG
ncbi:cupin-like domain-containing protein [Massilia yuzhufengensis]|uniref:Cupin-like domain-containing protein n=1 Tax=Massilia yuzhufengensis TaxID=1164594 RepID=A0A1I1GAL1_9BURK|nr:cupin-like domain-containing protein [Massilia yuzhufengensis]SFC06878.1 Cupin-like domain-containing protein [Massilia yuzhufengensis]